MSTKERSTFVPPTQNFNSSSVVPRSTPQVNPDDKPKHLRLVDEMYKAGREAGQREVYHVLAGYLGHDHKAVRLIAEQFKISPKKLFKIKGTFFYPVATSDSGKYWDLERAEINCVVAEFTPWAAISQIESSFCDQNEGNWSSLEVSEVISYEGAE